MWCRHCQQDVAGTRQPQSASFACARCGHAFARHGSTEVGSQAIAAPAVPSPGQYSEFATFCDSETGWSTSPPQAKPPKTVPNVPVSTATGSSISSRSSAGGEQRNSEQLRVTLDVIDGALQQIANPRLAPSAASDVPARPESLREITRAELPPSTPTREVPPTERSRRTIDALDREIRAVEEVLRGWQPRRTTREDLPSQQLVRHFGSTDSSASSSESPSGPTSFDRSIPEAPGRGDIRGVKSRRIGFRSEVVAVLNELRLHERQLGMALFANLMLLCVVGSVYAWDVMSGVAFPTSKILVLMLTGLMLNLLGLGWFVGQARAYADNLESAEQENEPARAGTEHAGSPRARSGSNSAARHQPRYVEASDESPATRTTLSPRFSNIEITSQSHDVT
ncbi:MAG: hypothetical protein KDA83_00360 [Planctomycetales bacterium]|nr:hypothetical protein [Planctomycetales bacterium]